MSCDVRCCAGNFIFKLFKNVYHNQISYIDFPIHEESLFLERMTLAEPRC